MGRGPDPTVAGTWERLWAHVDEASSVRQSTARADPAHAARGSVGQQATDRLRSTAVEVRRRVRGVVAWRPRRRDLLRLVPRRGQRARRSATSDLVDRSVFNAVGFDPDHDGVVLGVADLVELADRPAKLVRRVHRARCVSFGAERDGAPSMLELGLAGAALVDHHPDNATPRPQTPDHHPATPTPDTPTPDSRTADQLAVVASRSAASLTDARERELHSVVVRRAARRIVGQGSAAPSISVLLATSRPVHLEATLRSLASQAVRPQQVLVGMHGPGWSDADAALAHEILGEAVWIDCYDESLPLGVVLQSLTDHATGELVTKWDDDDWYGVHHLEDLVGALDDSGADLVGKAAEFVRLESIDLTIRRFAGGAEQFSSTLAGGTLMLTAAMLREVGGWAPVPRHVDRRLIEAVRHAGGLVYRTHGFEYLLRRTSSGHTWSADDDYFLGQASDVRPGLDLAFCGVDV